MKTKEALLDTGACVSLISQFDLKPQCKIIQPQQLPKLKSASGQLIPITGKANITFEWYKQKFFASPWITPNTLPQIILGRDFILKNMHIIKKLVNKKGDNREINGNAAGKIFHLGDNTDAKDLEIKLTNRFQDIFQDELNRNTICNIGKHRIATINDTPIQRYNFRIPIHYEERIDDEVQKLLQQGIIEKGTSAWNSSIVPVQKKDGKLRMCIDYRPLNKVTVKECYQLPLIDDIIDKLGNSSVFSTLDATSGYYQLAIEDESKEKPAFTWRREQYIFNRMPFGLCNAPITFQKVMDKILKDEPDVIAYLDDIILKSKTLEEHTKLLERIFGKLKAAGIVLNKKNVIFFEQN